MVVSSREEEACEDLWEKVVFAVQWYLLYNALFCCVYFCVFETKMWISESEFVVSPKSKKEVADKNSYREQNSVSASKLIKV